MLRYIGVNGFSLARGINWYSKKHHIKISARWGVKRARLAFIIQEMLEHKIPVILGIGRGLRWGIGKRGVCFYFDELCNYVDSQPMGIRYLLSNIIYIEETVLD